MTFSGNCSSTEQSHVLFLLSAKSAVVIPTGVFICDIFSDFFTFAIGARQCVG